MSWVFSWILNSIYCAFLIAYSPVLFYRIAFQNKSRRGWAQKLFGLSPRLPSSKQPSSLRIWIHAVSVGEVNLLTPIIKQLQESIPGVEVVISTSTETGFDLANKIHANHTVFFCPMDFTWAIKSVLRRMQPDMLILSELELWPNLINTTAKFGTKVAIVNARLSESSFRGYQRIGFLMKPILEQVELIAVQNSEYEQRFLALGCRSEQVEVTGSIKFDNAIFDRENNRTRELSNLLSKQADFVFVGGSTQFEEDKMLVDSFIRQPFGIQLILVPRHPERCDRLCQFLDSRQIKFVRRSEMESGDHADGIQQKDLTEGQPGRLPVVIVDVIGELAAWWGLANAGYVGGSMGSRGGQNMIEPAAFGVPVCFGPKTANFRQVVNLLLSAQAAEVVVDQTQLDAFVDRSRQNSKWASDMGQRARTLVMEQQGATGATVRQIRRCLIEVASGVRKAA